MCWHYYSITSNRWPGWLNGHPDGPKPVQVWQHYGSEYNCFGSSFSAYMSVELLSKQIPYIISSYKTTELGRTQNHLNITVFGCRHILCRQALSCWKIVPQVLKHVHETSDMQTQEATDKALFCQSPNLLSEGTLWVTQNLVCPFCSWNALGYLQMSWWCQLGERCVNLLPGSVVPLIAGVSKCCPLELLSLSGNSVFLFNLELILSFFSFFIKHKNS